MILLWVLTCRPSDEQEEVDEAFYGQLAIASPSQAPVFLGTSTILVFVEQHGPAHIVQEIPGGH